jgi:protein-disulfide isomerase
MTRPAKAQIVWGIVAVVVVAAIAFGLTVDPGLQRLRASLGSGPGLSQAAFEQRVRAYLLEHPEVIAEAVQRLEARRQASAEAAQAAVVTAHADELLHDAASPVGGNPDGDVSLVEFFDYNCPYCRRVAPVMHDAVAADPRLRIVYKEFPILGPGSVAAARAALAAHRQGRYVEFHDAMMARRGAVDEASVLAVAESLGLDLERLRRDMADPAIQAAIDRNVNLAGALRISGTPGFVVGAQILRSATDLATLQRLVQQAREGGQ